MLDHLEHSTKSRKAGDVDEISVKELFFKLRDSCRYLRANWIVIVTASVLGGILGFVYAFLNKPVYTAECTFVLDQPGAGGLSQYEGIASIVGINVGRSEGVFQGENILALYKSRRMVRKTLLSKASFNGKMDRLINRYIETKRLREDWIENPALMKISFDIPESQFTLRHDSLITQIVADINRNYLFITKPDKNLSVIKVMVKSEDEIFAKTFSDQIVTNVNNFYIETKTKQATKNLQILQNRADSVRRLLNSSIGGTAFAVDANPNANPAMQALKVPSQKKQVDVQVSSAIYMEIVKNLEIAKMTVLQETPLIQIIDQPVYPLQKTKIGKLTGMGIGAIFLAFSAACFLIVKKQILGI